MKPETDYIPLLPTGIKYRFEDHIEGLIKPKNKVTRWESRYGELFEISRQQAKLINYSRLMWYCELHARDYVAVRELSHNINFGLVALSQRLASFCHNFYGFDIRSGYPWIAQKLQTPLYGMCINVDRLNKIFDTLEDNGEVDVDNMRELVRKTNYDMKQILPELTKRLPLLSKNKIKGQLGQDTINSIITTDVTSLMGHDHI